MVLDEAENGSCAHQARP